MTSPHPRPTPHALLPNESGLILIGALFTMIFFLSISLAVASFGITHFISTKRTYTALNAISLADAGAESFMYNINQDKTYTGTGGPITLYNDDIKGKGTFETTITNQPLNNEKIVTSIGKVYLPRNSSTPKVTRKVKLTIRGIEPFIYSVQSGGSGPIYLYGNTNFTSGTLHSNKYIRIQDSGVTAKGSFEAADKDPTAGYASYNCSISGNNNFQAGSIIKVRYRVTVPNCGIGTTGSTVSENDASIVSQPLPTVDRATILSSITTNAACTSITNSPYEIKQAHYPDNTPSSGVNSNPNCVDFSLKKNETYTLKGNVHIRGNLTMESNSIIADGLATTDLYVLVEGKITVKGNGSSVSSNANNVSIIFVSYDPTDSGGDKTLPDAITISGNSLSLVAKYFALNGSLGFKGKGSIGPIAANSIVMDGSGSTSFININGVPLDPSIWDVRIYQQAYD